MKTIYKYPFKVEDSFLIDMPMGAEILSVETQRGTPCVWALVDTSKPVMSYRFCLRGTGHDCDGLSSSGYIGTFQMFGGDLVFHLFRDES